MNCPQCQTDNPDAARFCMNCGTSLTAASQPQSSREIDTRPIHSLDRFIPRELQVKFEAARANDAMVGERRVITMLFCDVKGSTAAAEKVDPETWTEIMNGIFEVMIRPIYKYEGTVPRLMGDAILAFFGAPIAHEDDPQRAVLAALEIQEGIQPHADEVRLRHGLEFALRVGINTGLVVVGQIGSDLRMEYTAIGDAINLAARMEQTAAPGTIQISEETYKLVTPFFDLEPLGAVEVKGKSAPIKTYRPLGAKKTPGHLRGLEGLSSPLVGREAEFALLERTLQDLENGSGSFITVVGEAGLGKSSLISAIQKPRTDAALTWLRGDALSYARSISYFPWRQIIRQSIEAHENDSPAEVRAKLRYVCDCCRLPGGDIPFLEALLAVESRESLQAVAGYQGEALVQMMVNATQRYLCGLANEHPRVIVLDDLHWADEASINLLLGLAELTKDHPILFICMLRPDHSAASWDAIQKISAGSALQYHAIHLEPLHSDQTEALLANLLGMKNLPKRIQDLIVEKAEGNPFFIEELIRSLIETKQIVRSSVNSLWEAVSEDAKFTLPNTLRGVLSARIDRLPEATKHVLQNAAVIGRSFEVSILGRLTQLNGGLDAHLQHLLQASLVEPSQGEYAFRHVLIQESAYDSILIKKRTDLHRQIGETLEELHADRLEEFAPLIAHHFYNAQDARSLKYALLAGEKAARLYANAEAATHFARALEAARRHEFPPEQIVKIHTQLGSALELSGRYEQALQNYDEMQAFGHEIGGRFIEMSALMAKATMYSIFTRLHNPTLSEQVLLQALDISREINDRTAQAKLSWNLMLTYLFSKRFDQALQHGNLALSLARESGDHEQLAFVLNDFCRLHTCRGEFEESLQVIREARDLWRTLDNQVMLADSLGSEAEAHFNSGAYERAFRCCEEALQITEKIDNLWGQSYDQMIMAFVHLETGRLGEGIRLAEKSIRLADTAGLMAGSLWFRSELGWIYAYCGDFEKAHEVIGQALQIADAKQPAWKAFPQAGKIRIHLLQGDLGSAKRSAEASLFETIAIPYARYTIFEHLANVELAISNGDHEKGLKLADDLLNEAAPLTRVDIPEVLRWKGLALFGLKRHEEAHQVLAEARSRAEDSDSNLHLWPILAGLADVNSKLGNQSEADANREQARRVIAEIAESLHEVGLRDSFLNQPRVQSLKQ
ncbi:MAG: adenylate/guanylate cyclase domain-containing protein [Chloroflexota bacterium]